MGKTAKQYIDQLLENLKLSKKVAQANLEYARTRSKYYHDRDAKATNFYLGQKVLKYTPHVKQGHSKGLQKFWSGPYKIADIDPSNNTCQLRRCDTYELIKRRINCTRLKPFYDPVDRVDYEADEDNDDDNNDPPMPDSQTQQISQNSQHSNKDVNLSRDESSQSVSQQATQQDVDVHDTNAPDSDQRPLVDNSQESDKWYPVESVLKATKYKGRMMYRVKFQAGDIQWLDEDNLSPALKRDFHHRKTWSGKVKKKKRNPSLFLRQ